MITPFTKKPEAKENEHIYVWTSEYLLGGEQRGNPPQNNSMSQRKRRRGETEQAAAFLQSPFPTAVRAWTRTSPGDREHQHQRISILKSQRDSSHPLAK